MSNFFTFIFILSIGITQANAQGFKNIFKKDSTGRSSIDKLLTKGQGSNLGLSTDEIAGGLKEALRIGAEKGSTKLSTADGFFKDAVLKILMPAEAVKAEQKLRSIGFGKQVDNAILAMNRAAEDAARSAAPIFVNAIKQMTFQDALGILRGGDNAATNYLKTRTTTNLAEAFRPLIENSLVKVNATKHWNTVFSTYNAFSSEKVNTDLAAYVTEKALAGIFYQVSLEEQQIRKDPLARTSDILKRVFGK